MPLVIENIAEGRGLRRERSETERMLRAILDNVPAGISYLNTKEQFQFTNQGYEFLLGIKADALIGSTLEQALGKKPYKVAGKFAKRALKGETVSHENVLLPRTGGEISVLVSYVPDVGPDNVIRGFYALVEDISEHKRLEAKLSKRTSEMSEAYEALEKSEAILNEAQRIAKIGSWEWDILTDDPWWSDEVHRMYGTDRQSFKANYDAFFEHVHPDDRKLVADSIQRALDKSEEYSIDHRIITTDGTEKIVHEQAEVTFDADGRPIRMTGTVQDITEQKRIAGELADQRERLRRLLESTNAVPWEADIQTWSFTYVGPKATTLLGFPNERWLEKDFWVRHMHPDDKLWAIDYCRKCSEELDDYEFEYRMIAKDGRIVWLQDIVNVVWSNGERVGLRGFMIDITDRKRSEKVLRELTARVIAAQEDEQKRIARELHDHLSQELALIAVELDLLKRDLPKNRKAVLQKLANVQGMAKDASSAVHKISHRLHPAMLDQLGLVAAVGAYCNEVSARQGPQIEFNNLIKLDHVPADISLSFYRVLQEAVQNSLKHSGSDAIRVKLFSKGKEICLIVEDDGCGFQVEPNADYGLGLTSMAERMELGGGIFKISSEPGKGTKITVCQALEQET